MSYQMSYSSDSPNPGGYHFPAEHCKDAWSEVKSEDYLYDFVNDSNISNIENGGYENYLERLKKKNLIRQNCHKNWTVFIYMAATNDLIPYSYNNLYEMESGSSVFDSSTTGSSLRTDVIVQLHTQNNDKTRRYHIFQNPENKPLELSKDEALKLTENDIHSPFISIPHKITRSKQSQRLEDFLSWGIENYPSEHYLLIIWGHGKKGELAIEGADEYLDFPRIREVLQNFKKWTGSSIDVFATDSCLCQTIEDVTELSGCTDFICGSEGRESLAGYPYGNLLYHLNSGTFNSAPSKCTGSELAYSEPYLLAWMISQLYKESLDPENGTHRKIDPKMFLKLTASSISTKHLNSTLIPALHYLGIALSNFIDENPKRRLQLNIMIQEKPFFEDDTQDLGILLKKLNTLIQKEITNNNENPTPSLLKLKKALTDTYNALSYTIVNAALGKEYSEFDPKKEYGPMGISVWLPRTIQSFKSRIDKLSKSLFYTYRIPSKGLGWQTWIMKLYE